MKTKKTLNLIGGIGNLYVYEYIEEPSGQIKNKKDFGKYLDYFKNVFKSHFKTELLSRSDFCVGKYCCRAIPKEIDIKKAIKDPTVS